MGKLGSPLKKLEPQRTNNYSFIFPVNVQESDTTWLIFLAFNEPKNNALLSGNKKRNHVGSLCQIASLRVINLSENVRRGVWER